MAPGFSEENGQEKDVWVLPLSQWNTTTVFIRVPWNTIETFSSLYLEAPVKVSTGLSINPAR
jgi:hypothetical protein